MAPYVYDYQKDMLRVMSDFRLRIDDNFPPEDSVDFKLIAESIQYYKNQADICSKESLKQSFDCDTNACYNVSIAISALANVLQDWVNEYKA